MYSFFCVIILETMLFYFIHFLKVLNGLATRNFLQMIIKISDFKSIKIIAIGPPILTDPSVE